MLRRRPFALSAALLAVIAAAALWSALGGTTPLDLYRAIKREIADERLAWRLRSVPCPPTALVIAALGQSNAGNHVDLPVAADHALPAYVWFRGRCYPAADPLPGSSGEGGSLWTLLAHRLARVTGRPVVVIAGGADGSSVASWADRTWFQARRMERAMQAAARNGLPADLVVWHQGETDSVAGTSAADYERDLRLVIGRFAASARRDREGRGALWLVFQASRCGAASTVSEAIRSAQRAVATPERGVYPGPDTDALGDDWRTDGCHFNSVGRERIVAQMVELIVAGGLLSRLPDRT